MNFVFTDEHDELRQTVRASCEKSPEARCARDGQRRTATTPTSGGSSRRSSALGPDHPRGARRRGLRPGRALDRDGRDGTRAALRAVPRDGRSRRTRCSCATPTQKELSAEDRVGRGDRHGRPGRGTGAGNRRHRAGAQGRRRDWMLERTRARPRRADRRRAAGRRAAARGPRAVARERDASGLSRSPIPPLDLTRKLARLGFANTPATRISSGDQTANFERVLALRHRARRRAGGRRAEVPREATATTRRAGSSSAARSAAIRPSSTSAPRCWSPSRWRSRPRPTRASSRREDEPDFVEAAALAKAYCSEAYFHAAADNIQIHGGMGFTWEPAPHLYFKRANERALVRRRRAPPRATRAAPGDLGRRWLAPTSNSKAGTGRSSDLRVAFLERATRAASHGVDHPVHGLPRRHGVWVDRRRAYCRNWPSTWRTSPVGSSPRARCRGSVGGHGHLLRDPGGAAT